jgi:threonine synthase
MKLDIRRNVFNIWRYSRFYPKIDLKNQLTLGEGWTKGYEAPSLAEQLKLTHLYFKREDLNPTGSHKDRSSAFQVSKALEDGQKELVLPSSGNCAVSVAAYSNIAHVKLTVFIHHEISRQKLSQLLRFKPKIQYSPRPIEDAEAYSVEHHVRNLSPEIDDNAVYGLESISFEIFERLGVVDEIFMPVSSAATLVGMGWANLLLKRMGLIAKLPSLHAVQTEAIAPIAEEFSPWSRKSKKSIADGIIAKTTARKEEAVRLIRESGGFGWIVSDREIMSALKILNRHGIDTSPEGGAAFAALLKAGTKKSRGRVVCLLTGHGLKWSEDEG